MKLLLLPCVLAAALTISCSKSEPPLSQPTPSGIDREEYKVISAALHQWEEQMRNHIPEMKQERYHFADDTTEAKVRYDSLTRLYGDLTYYFVLEDRTVKPSENPLDCPWEELKSKISNDLLLCFDSVNAKTCKLDRSYFSDSVVVELVPGPVDSMPEPKWRSDRSLAVPYPLVLHVVSVSRVGFNQQRTRALFYWELWAGWMASGGRYLLLEKKENAWVLLGAAKAWSSI